MEFMEQLWGKIQKELNERYPRWEEEAGTWYGPAHFPRDKWCPPGITRRENRNCRGCFCGPVLATDENLFKCFVYGLLTNTIDAQKFYLIINSGVLPGLFFNFDPAHYHAAGSSHVAVIVTEFGKFNAGAMVLRKSLERLQISAGILASASCKYGSINTYLFSIVKGVRHPICLACALGSTGNPYKLPGFGIALATESLKNMGCQMSKPDRHILRALGRFGLVNFRNWRTVSSFTPPPASDKDRRETMWTMDVWAQVVGVSPLLLDYAIWLLCAKSGLHLTNQDLENMAKTCTAKVSQKFVTRCLPCDYCR